MNRATRMSQPGWTVWFGLFGAPAAWSAQELIGWWIAGTHCASDTAGALAPAVGSRLPQLGVSVLALLVALAAVVAGSRAWRRTRQPGVHRIQAHDRPAFLAACGLLVSTVFVLAIVWAAAAAMTLPLCEAMR